MACRHKMLMFPLVKLIVSKFACINLENPKHEHFVTTSHRTVAWEIFSRTSDVLYCSKPWRDWSGLSIAPIPDRIRSVEATNDANEERRTTIPPEVPLKKTHNCWLFVAYTCVLVTSPLKMTKNHNVDIGVGVFVGIGVQALILHPDGAQRVLSTSPKPFYAMLPRYLIF